MEKKLSALEINIELTYNDFYWTGNFNKYKRFIAVRARNSNVVFLKKKKKKLHFTKKSFNEPFSWIPHQTRTQPEHESTKLHLIQSSIPIQITFSQHTHYFIFAHILQSKLLRIPLQALESDHTLLSIHQQPKPTTQLLHKPICAKFLHHCWKEIFKDNPISRCHLKLINASNNN